MADTVTSEGLMQLFAIMDKNNDKMVTLDEMQHGLRMFGYTEAEIYKFIKKYNPESDRPISLEEYKRISGIPDGQPEDADKPITGTATKGVLLSLFDRLDEDNDGRISQTELRREMSKLGARPDEIKTLFTFLDIDEDGSISRREYEIALCLSSERSVDWGAIFDTLDVDRSGDISVEEIKRVFDRVRMPILTPGIMIWISEYDVNKDGKLNYKEFLAFVKKGKAGQTWET